MERSSDLRIYLTTDSLSRLEPPRTLDHQFKCPDNFPALLKCVFQCACVFRISRIYVKSYNKHILTCTTKLKSITKKLNKDPITRISKKILPLLIQKDSKHFLWSDVFKFNDEY